MIYNMKRCIITILALVLLVSSIIPMNVFAAEPAMDPIDMTQILNKATLHPQRTGYKEIDSMIESILEPYKDADTYTKMRYLYYWTVKYVQYSWDGYSKTTAPCYDYFTKTYNLTYEEGLQEAYSMDVIYRTYHSLYEKKGVCYDYGILFAVMARYIGLEAYAHSGYYDFEDWSGIPGAGHHGWAEVVIDGKTYYFDPQRDYRLTERKRVQTYDYFGIPYEAGWRYHYKPDTEANAARDALLLPVAEHRHYNVDINVICSSSGTLVNGTGTHLDCEEITLSSASSTPVKAWYTLWGDLVAAGPTYKVPAGEDANLAAIFEGDIFLDVPKFEWYATDVNEAAILGLTNGVNAIQFKPAASMSRAMVVQFLARLDGADAAAAPAVTFEDVDQNAWYADAVNWAYQKGIITGFSEKEFAPDQTVTRQDFITMVMRYLASAGHNLEAAELKYSDASKINGYALKPMQQAQAISLVQGYPDNTLQPDSGIVRSEGVTLLMRTYRYLESLKTEAEEPAA